MRKSIAIDLDFTLVEFIVPYWTIVNQHVNELMNGAPPVKLGPGVWSPAEWEFLKRLFRSPWYMANVRPLPFAMMFLCWAMENFEEVHVVTAREEPVRGITEKVMTNAFDKHHAKRCIYDYVNMNDSKMSLLERIEASVVVDDSPAVCLEAINAGLKVYMVRQPWNEYLMYDKGAENITPVNTLDNIIRMETEGSFTNGKA